MGRKWAISRVGEWRETRRHGAVKVLMRDGQTVNQVERRYSRKPDEHVVEHEASLTPLALAMSPEELNRAIKSLRIRI